MPSDQKLPSEARPAPWKTRVAASPGSSTFLNYLASPSPSSRTFSRRLNRRTTETGLLRGLANLKKTSCDSRSTQWLSFQELISLCSAKLSSSSKDCTSSAGSILRIQTGWLLYTPSCRSYSLPAQSTIKNTFCEPAFSSTDPRLQCLKWRAFFSPSLSTTSVQGEYQYLPSGTLRMSIWQNSTKAVQFLATVSLTPVQLFFFWRTCMVVWQDWPRSTLQITTCCSLSKGTTLLHPGFSTPRGVSSCALSGPIVLLTLQIVLGDRPSTCQVAAITRYCLARACLIYSADIWQFLRVVVAQPNSQLRTSSSAGLVSTQFLQVPKALTQAFSMREDHSQILLIDLVKSRSPSSPTGKQLSTAMYFHTPLRNSLQQYFPLRLCSSCSSSRSMNQSPAAAIAASAPQMAGPRIPPGPFTGQCMPLHSQARQFLRPRELAVWGNSSSMKSVFPRGLAKSAGCSESFFLRQLRTLACTRLGARRLGKDSHAQQAGNSKSSFLSSSSLTLRSLLSQRFWEEGECTNLALQQWTVGKESLD